LIHFPLQILFRKCIVYPEYLYKLNFIRELHKTILYIALLTIAILSIVACNSNKKNKAFEYSGVYSDSIFINLDQKLIDSRARHIDSVFTRLSKNNWFNGCVAYSEKGRLVYSGAYGLSDLPRKDSLNVNSSFQLASVSKMFTAMAVMILKERGELKYDDSVQVCIPGFPYHGVTIRQLLIHRAGLPRYMSIAHEHWENKKQPMNNEDVLQLFKDYYVTPYFKPDNGFHYCNSNYAVLASVVERVSGQTFDVFVQQNIFDPLEMENSFVYNHNNDTIVPLYIPVGVSGHYNRRWRWRRMEDEYLNGVMGDKGVYSSVIDLMKWEQALYKNLLVGDSTIKEAFTKGSPKWWRRKDNYGFGWRIPENKDSTVYHYGWWKGFRNFYIRDMKTKKTIIVLTNKEKGPGSAHIKKILQDERFDLGFVCENPDYYPPEQYQ